MAVVAGESGREVITDEELASLALAADPDAEVDDDAVPCWEIAHSAPDSLLPDWYMPSPMSGARGLRGWRRRVVIGLVVAFVLINAAGLCSTYGFVVVA
jgi:hypothetical protein